MQEFIAALREVNAPMSLFSNGFKKFILENKMLSFLTQVRSIIFNSKEAVNEKYLVNSMIMI